MLKRVVIADDSATARMFIRRCLEIVGCTESTFIEAGNGKEALAGLQAAPADLLVTDLTMPEMDGLALLKQIQASPRLNDLPVVVITSAMNPARREELLRCGALAVLEKPVSPAALAEALEPLLPARDDTP